MKSLPTIAQPHKFIRALQFYCSRPFFKIPTRKPRRLSGCLGLLYVTRGSDTVLEHLSRDKTETLFAFGLLSRMQPLWIASPLRDIRLSR